MVFGKNVMISGNEESIMIDFPKVYNMANQTNY
jgi:hypothetical protein